MRMKKLAKMILTFLLVTVTAVVFTVYGSAADGKWIGAWGTGPAKLDITGYKQAASLVGPVTARSIITPTASGTKVRFLISNRFGDSPLTINSMYVAKSTGKGKIDALSSSPVTVNGRSIITVPAGAEVYSDEINFRVTAMVEIAISYFLQDFSSVTTVGLSGGTTYLNLGEQDRTREETISTLAGDKDFGAILELIFGNGFKLSGETIDIMPCVVTMDVLAAGSAYSAVVIGDSTVANDFPLKLADVLYKQGITNVGVVSKGIFGNKLLTNGLGSGDLLYAESLLSRLQKDALNVSGVEYVIVKIGANDIMHPVSRDSDFSVVQPSAQQIIDGYKELIKLCHSKDIKVIALGITQWKGCSRDYFDKGPQYIRSDAEIAKDWAIALKVNEWLATTDEHDGYVSFTDISKSAKEPLALDPNYTVDGIHPTVELQQIWADYFPTSLIGVGNRTAGVILSIAEKTIFKGENFTLTPEVYPESAANKAVTWSSSKPAVATVDENGKITPVSNGSAVITCKTVEGGYTAQCKITVKTKATAIELEKTSATIYTTKGVYIVPTVIPADASDKTVTYKSSDTSIAKVSSKGYVTGVGAGTATITVTNSENQTAKFKIKVVKKTQVTAIELNYDDKGVYTGKTFSLVADVQPSNATYKDVEWSSSNEKIATVTEDGVVKGISAGKARITCKSLDNPMVSKTCIVTVKVQTTGVRLNYTTMTVYTTVKRQLTATVLPSTATNKKVTWETENKKIATVDKNGVVTGLKEGTTYITCTTNNSGKTATCKVVVKKGVLSKKVTLNKTKISIYDGKTYTLKATVSPSNTTTKTLKWSSSDTSVAKVSSKGVVTAVAPGTAVITCKTKDTGKTVKCTVTVKKVVPKSVAIDKDYYQVGYKKSIQLTATISPSNSTDKTLVWTSSNPKYAKVSSTGKVTGLKSGKTVTITVTTKSGKRVDTCQVRVGTVSVTGVELNKTSAVVGPGGNLQLKATVSPSTATNKKVKWSSSDESVATVDSNGLVTGVTVGKANIYCMTEDGKLYDICQVTVKQVAVMGIKLDKNTLNLAKGKTYTLVATVIPEEASNQKVTWESTDTSVAKVNSNGKVTAVAKGTCRIRVISSDGNWIATCLVTVS